MRYNVVLKSFFTNSSVIAAVKLSFVWLSGLVFGFFVGADTVFGFGPQFLSATSVYPAFLGILLVLFIPLLCTVCLRFLISPDSVLLVVLLKAAVFSIVVIPCFCSWRSAGWLISRLLLFSDFFSLPVLIWTWYRILCCNFGRREVFVSVALLLIIGLTDYFVISPFLCSLF